jgi:hypothetical protein
VPAAAARAAVAAEREPEHPLPFPLPLPLEEAILFFLCSVRKEPPFLARKKQSSSLLLDPFFPYYGVLHKTTPNHSSREIKALFFLASISFFLLLLVRNNL